MSQILNMAIADTRSILNGGFSIPLTITDLLGNTYVINGLASVHSQSFDENGNPAIGDNSHVTFSEKDLTDLGAKTRRGKELEVQNWTVEFDHEVGRVKAKLREPAPDSTLGLIRVMIQNHE